MTTSNRRDPYLPTSADAGCWVDGHTGQYGIARMILIAEGLGYVDEAARMPFATLDCVSLARRHYYGSDISDEEVENMHQAADDVESWLNANAAPDGYSFGWHDGEFFLQSDEWWQQD